MDILIIGDTQCKPNHDLSYCSHIGQFIAERQPDVIVHIGDHYDFEALSSYDRGKKSFEGRRLIADIEAGHKGMELIMAPIKALQENQKKNRKKAYSPRMIFTMGNHEERFDRLANDMPELDGFVGTKTLKLEQFGWEVYSYLVPAEIEGIYFVHFLANPFSGKPYGGNALNQLKTIGRSFVVGHKQTLDIAIRPTIDGKLQVGIINGSCYTHDESYKGPQGNNHFRGLTVLKNVKDGFGTPEMVSLEELQDKYNGQ
ncbi:hypothetical protein D3C87_323570 [compost metagenome]